MPRDNRNIPLDEDINIMRIMHSSGEQMHDICARFPQYNPRTISAICHNDLHYDPNYIPLANNSILITDEEVKDIRYMRDHGYSFEAIHEKYPKATITRISDIANNKARIDPKYIVPDRSAFEHPGRKKISDEDVIKIRDLYNKGMNITDIHRRYYKDFISRDLVWKICKNILHKDINYIPR